VVAQRRHDQPLAGDVNGHVVNPAFYVRQRNYFVQVIGAFVCCAGAPMSSDEASTRRVMLFMDLFAGLFVSQRVNWIEP
jgi:hypothetical protein